MQLCVCTHVVCDALVAVEIHWVIVCRFISLVSLSLALTFIANGQINIHTHRSNLPIQPNIMNVANTESDSWMWLNPRLNRPVTGDFSAVSAWVTERRREELSALASAPLSAVIVLLSKVTNAPQSHDSEVHHLSTEKVVSVSTKIENDVQIWGLRGWFI